MSHSSAESDNTQVSLQGLPRTALQAIYHAVTGKTENLSQSLKKNVVIRFNDFDQLYYMLKDQAEHYDILSSPTVSIVVKQIDSKSIQYSSWERFREFQTGAASITSEVNIKMEFITNIPNTHVPQRFVISIGLDSGLPIIHSRLESGNDEFYMSFFAHLAKAFPTAEISIDFVDFLIAKIFAATVEEWFNNLEVIKVPRISLFFLDRTVLVSAVINQFGRIGLALFIASYAWFNSPALPSLVKIFYATSIAMLIWSLLSVLSSALRSAISKRIFRGIMPSVILFTSGDQKAFDRCQSGVSKPWISMLHVALATIFSMFINVLSSYIYSYFTKL